MTSTALACTVKNYLRVVENLTADLRIYTKGNSSDEELSPEGDKPLEDNSDKKNITTPESLATAKEFFHPMEDKAHYPSNSRCEQKVGFLFVLSLPNHVEE